MINNYYLNIGKYTTMKINQIINFDTKINDINNKKQPKIQYNTNPVLQNDTFEFTGIKSDRKFSPSFAGFWGRRKADDIPLDGKVLLSEKQLLNGREKVIAEIDDIIRCGEYSEAKAERLDKLLHSQFVSYDFGCFGPFKFTLNDLLAQYTAVKDNRLYAQFVATSLGETNPRIDKIEDYRMLYNNNVGIRNSLKNYLEIDENSKEAEVVRKMVKRLFENNVKVPIYPQFFAECLLNGKSQMCKMLMEDLGISPFTEVPMIRDEDCSLIQNKIVRESSYPVSTNINDYVGVEGYSKVYGDLSYSGKRYNSPFLIIYDENKKYAAYERKTSRTLYQIAALSKYPECKNFFDMPEYLYQSYQGNTDFDWYGYKRIFGIPGDVCNNIGKFFSESNFRYHPEIKGLDFNVDLLSKLVKGGVDLENTSLWRIPRRNGDMFMEAFKKLKELDNENLEDAEIKKKALEYICKCTAPKAFDEQVIEKILEAREYFEVEDLQKLNPNDRRNLIKTIQGNFIASYSSKYDIYDIKEWNKILDDMNNNTTLRPLIPDVVVNNLVDIFYTPENKKDYAEVVNKLRKFNVNWNYTDEFGNNLAHRAVEAENPLLIDLAKEKEISFVTPNKTGQTAADLIKRNCSSPVLSDVKINSDDLLKFAKLGLASGVKILLTNPVLDVNSVNEDGDSAAILAARKGHHSVIRELNKSEDFDVNYVNPKTLESAYTAASDAETRKAVVENVNFTPLKSDYSDFSKLFDLIDSNAPVQDIIKLIQHLSSQGALNLKIMKGGKTLQDKLQEYAYNKGANEKEAIHKLLYSRLQEGISKNFLSRIRQIVDANGVLSIDQIKSFVNYPDASKIVNEPLNDIDEPIGFFIADHNINGDNIMEIVDVIERLKSLHYDFWVKNKLNQTMLEKAKDAENQFLIEYLASIGVKN